MSERLRRPLALGLGLLAIVVAVVVVAASGGDDPPATGSAKLVPADALVYVHLSTDEDRAATRRAFTLASRLPDFRRVQTALLARLRVTGRGTGDVEFGRDIRPWLGKEAALALVPDGGTARSLIVLHVAKRRDAELFLARLGRPTAVAGYHGTAVSSYGPGQDVALTSDHLLAGAPAVLRAGLDAEAGRRPSLAGDPAYKRAAAGEPAGRFADIYSSVEGVRRVLAPRPGLLGTLGSLLDQPALSGTAVSLSARADGLRVRVHSSLAAGASGRLPSAFRPFAPSLPQVSPAPALAFVALSGLDRSLPRLLGAAGSGGVAARLGLLISRAGRSLRAAGVDVQRDVAPVFRDQVAVLITPHDPVPVLTLIARTPDEQRAREAFAQLQAPIARMFAPPGSGPGQAPTFSDRTVAGVHAFQLKLSPSLELDYAVFDGRLVASTSLDGIAAARGKTGRIDKDPAFRTALAGRPKTVTSLVFLDLSQLLGLGEQIGLGRDPRYLRVRADLRKVRAVGLYSSAGETDTTAELFFQIP